MKMKQLSWVAIVIALAACSGNEKRRLGDLPVVAHQVEVDGQEMTVCELDLLKDTIDLPLSCWVEDFEAVKLDGRDEALVGQGAVSVSDNYIVVNISQNVPCKLFRRDGSYISSVGSFGQGPGEYQYVSDIQIDEQNGCIYLLPWRSKAILVYDMMGKYVKSIPLNKKYENLFVPKGKIKVDVANNRIAVMSLPFDNLPVVAWIQDMDGNVIHEVPMNHLKIKPSYNNEVYSVGASEASLDVFIYTYHKTRKDTLYHLNMENGKLYPKFTLNFGESDIAIHDYFEFPGHYIGSLGELEKKSSYLYVTSDKAKYIVEKATGKGAFVRICNDFWDNVPVENITSSCDNGYYALNIEPSVLMERLEKGLRNNPDEKRRKRMEALLRTIDEDDNNYIFIGKLKTEFGNADEK